MIKKKGIVLGKPRLSIRLQHRCCKYVTRCLKSGPPFTYPGSDLISELYKISGFCICPPRLVTGVFPDLLNRAWKPRSLSVIIQGIRVRIFKVIKHTVIMKHESVKICMLSKVFIYIKDGIAGPGIKWRKPGVYPMLRRACGPAL